MIEDHRRVLFITKHRRLQGLLGFRGFGLRASDISEVLPPQKVPPSLTLINLAVFSLGLRIVVLQKK